MGSQTDDTIFPAFASSQNVNNANGYEKGPTQDSLDSFGGSNFNASGYLKDPNQEKFNFVESELSYQNANGYEKDPILDFEYLKNILYNTDHQVDLVGFIDNNHQLVDEDNPTSPTSSTGSEFERFLNSEMPLENSPTAKENHQLVDEDNPTSPTSSTGSEFERFLYSKMPVENSPTGKEKRDSPDTAFSFSLPESPTSSLEKLPALSPQLSVPPNVELTCSETMKNNNSSPNVPEIDMTIPICQKTTAGSSSDFHTENESPLHSPQTRSSGKVKKRRQRKAKSPTERERYKAERKERNNIASRKHRQQQKDDAEKLEKNEKELLEQNKELRNQLIYVEGGINEITSSFAGIAEHLIRNDFSQFQQNLLNLIHAQNQAINFKNRSGDATYEEAIDKVVQLYRGVMDKTLDVETRKRLLLWLCSQLRDK